jgi:hypothetical protein
MLETDCQVVLEIKSIGVIHLESVIYLEGLAEGTFRLRPFSFLSKKESSIV